MSIVPPASVDGRVPARPSVLFGLVRATSPDDGGRPMQPACFRDLLLDRIVELATAGRESYDLEASFLTPLRDVELIVFRQEVMRDVDRDDVSHALQTFAEAMGSVRRHLGLAERLHHHHQRLRWFVDAAAVYTDAVSALANALANANVRSRGLAAIRDYLTAYLASEPFRGLVAEAAEVVRALASVDYEVSIKGPRVTVSRYDGESDLSAEVRRTFAKFEHGVDKDYRATFSSGYEMSQVEGRILDLVARLFPEPFAALEGFRDGHRDFIDGTVRVFDREIQFYLAYAAFIAPIRAAGLSFCYPRVSGRSKEVRADQAFDLALADKLVRTHEPVVCNDVALTGSERVLVVTGPNQGGKTTFARMFGQLHYLASLGLPVPGRRARLFLPDGIFTHFEREEDIHTLRGKLEDELIRSHEILEQASSASVVIMNESLTSTSLSDALWLGTRVLGRIVEIDGLCVWVTFVDELSTLGSSTVSMVAEVDPDDPATRTFHVARRPADGRAYASALARRHGLTYDAVKERVAR